MDHELDIDEMLDPHNYPFTATVVMGNKTIKYTYREMPSDGRTLAANAIDEDVRLVGLESLTYIVMFTNLSAAAGDSSALSGEELECYEAYQALPLVKRVWLEDIVNKKALATMAISVVGEWNYKQPVTLENAQKLPTTLLINMIDHARSVTISEEKKTTSDKSGRSSPASLA